MITSDLITKSYYLSGKVSRDFETLSGSDLEDGLMLLNFILSELGSNGRYIPYYDRYQFDTVVGQEVYFVENLTELETITFNLQDVRFSMLYRNRDRYFGYPRIDNLQALPVTYTTERTLNGMNVYLYFTPNQIYTIKITGQFTIGPFTYDEDLSTKLDSFFQQYLIYKLASRICEYNSITFDTNKMMTLMALEKKIPEVNIRDLTCEKTSYFGSGLFLNLGQINIGRGYSP